ncbi:MAG: aminotransferase class I/II-fold pyridoxal phosphate-dependent enzyme [Gemmatimonadales bacterium]
MLLLDRNEGGEPPTELLQILGAMDAGVLRRYPDPRYLETALGRRFNVAPERVLVTAGGDDAIDRCCRAFLDPNRTAILSRPTFEMLERSLALTRCTIECVPWGHDEFPTDDVIAKLDERVGLIALVSPNNPTGLCLGVKSLRRVARAAADAIVLLDHAYVEYADHDLTGAALALPNVVIVRTFSKAWGLAGCRIGFALGSTDLIRALRASGGPYPVSALSLALARKCLEGDESIRLRHVGRVKFEREVLAERLRIDGAMVPNSQANFVLAGFGPRASFVRDAMATAGVLVRDFSRRPGIEGSLRLTLPGNELEFARLNDALDLVLRPQAILIDLDGVIADVRGSYRRCIIATAASFGVTLSAREIRATIAAGDANNDWLLTQQMLEKHGVSAPLAEITRRFQASYLGSGLHRGLRDNERVLVDADVMAALARRFSLAIVSGRPRAEADWFLERAGMRHCFAAVVAMEDAPLKPDPAPVRLALQRLGARRGWMLGDTPDDVRAAGEAGVLPIGVVAPGHDATATTRVLRQAGAAWVIRNLTELEDLIS